MALLISSSSLVLLMANNFGRRVTTGATACDQRSFLRRTQGREVPEVREARVPVRQAPAAEVSRRRLRRRRVPGGGFGGGGWRRRLLRRRWRRKKISITANQNPGGPEALRVCSFLFLRLRH